MNGRWLYFRAEITLLKLKKQVDLEVGSGKWEVGSER